MTKKWYKALGTMIAVTMMASLLGGCGGAKSDSQEIKIGGNFELTGGIANFGVQTVNGIKLAIKEANEKGGVNGKKITFVTADNKSEAAEAANAITKLITQDKAVVILGPVSSSNVLATVQIAQDNKIPLLTATATNPNVTAENGKVKPYVFRACFIDPFQGKVMSDFATKTLNAKTAAIYVDNSSDYSKGLAEVFEKTFTAAGGKIVAKEAFLQKDQDFNFLSAKHRVL
jgi:branched-chain amino acid transport system substrate-binding protein